MNKNIQERLANFNFYRHGNFRNFLLFTYVIFTSLTRKNFAKSGIKKAFNPLIALNQDFFTDEDNEEELADAFYRKIKKNRNFLDKFEIRHAKDYQEIIDGAKKISRKKYETASNGFLLKLFKSWIKINEKHQHWLWSMDFSNPAVDKFVKEKIEKHLGKIDESLFILSEPSKDLDAIKSKIDILKCAVKIKRGRITIKKAAGDMEKKYGWLGFNTWDGSPVEYDYFYKLLQKITKNNPENELKKILFEKRQRKEEYEIVIREFQTSEQIFFRSISNLIYLKSARIEVISKSIWYLYDFYKEICSRLHIGIEDIFYMKPEEIYRGLCDKKVDRSVIKERKKNYCVMLLDGKVYDFAGKDFAEIKKYIRVKKQLTNKLSGSVAYPGKVTGIVRVVNNESELNKVKSGDILVAPLTNPSYDIVLNKISAMVADEGGILTHTAIVAREFKIPTILGTKIATQILKDGDLVEVDANKGIVKILKKA